MNSSELKFAARGPLADGAEFEQVGRKALLTVSDLGMRKASVFLKPLVWMAAVFLAETVIAQPLSISSAGQFSITAPLAGDQTKPQAAVSPTNGIVVWQDNSVDDRGLRIRAQRLDALYQPVGEPINVSSSKSRKTTGDLENPQVALLPDGSALVVWQGGLNGQQCIYCQVINPDGTTASKKDRKLTKSRKIKQVDPALAVLQDGNIALVYSSSGQDGSMQGVFGQVIDGNGKTVIGEFQVNQRSQFNQRNPSVAGLANGNFVVAWVSELQRSSNGRDSVDIYARMFDPSGTAVTPEFPVNPAPDRLCANPAVAASSAGFAVAWSQSDQELGPSAGAFVLTTGNGVRSTNSWDVFAQFFDADGVATSMAPVQVNAHAYGDQFAPALVASSGAYMAAWTSLGQDGSREGVFGKLFGTAGEAAGDELAINLITASRQFQPAISSDGTGRLLVVWTSFVAGTSFDLQARTYFQAGGQ